MTPEFIANSLILLAGGTLAWGFWRAAQPKPVFSVRLSEGKARANNGTVTPMFLGRIEEVAAANAISNGVVSGYAYGRHIRLRFSPEFPDAARQQLRNWWASFGWAAPKSAVAKRCC